MLLGAMLVLGYGPMNWAFPWWMWVLAIVTDIGSATVKVRRVT